MSHLRNLVKVILAGCVLVGGFFAITASQLSNEPIKPVKTIDKQFLIVAHISTEDASQFELLKPQIDSLMVEMNKAFVSINVSFSVCDYRMIDNPRYQDVNEEARIELHEKFQVEKRINIYFFNEFTDKPSAAGLATLGGVSMNQPNKAAIYIAMSKGGLGTGTMVHEMGHFFGLTHTFETGDELVDKSNCTVAGDQICDTPADPYVAGDNPEDYVDVRNCEFISVKKDVNGDYYNPHVSNYMSYYPSVCTCQSAFTKGQLNKMVDTYTRVYTPSNVGHFVW